MLFQVPGATTTQFGLSTFGGSSVYGRPVPADLQSEGEGIGSGFIEDVRKLDSAVLTVLGGVKSGAREHALRRDLPVDEENAQWLCERTRDSKRFSRVVKGIRAAPNGRPFRQRASPPERPEAR
jgi:hypothetical protein